MKLFPRDISEVYTQYITKSKMDSEEEVITASVSILVLMAGIRMMRQTPTAFLLTCTTHRTAVSVHMTS